jgi:hypothetical protein
MSQFKVGDVCVLLGHRDYREFHNSFVGSEITLTSFIGPIEGLEDYGDFWWGEFADGTTGRFAEIVLRLKRPPSDDTHLPADEEFTDWLRKQVGVKA